MYVGMSVELLNLFFYTNIRKFSFFMGKSLIIGKNDLKNNIPK